MDTKTIEAVMKTVTIDTKIDGGKIDAVIGERARMDVERAVSYIKSGEEEIKKAVREGKIDFNENAQDKTDDFNQNAVEKTQEFNQNAVNKTGDFNDNFTDKKNIIDGLVGDASNYADLAKQWAIGEPSEPTGNSAKYWAEQSQSAAATVNDNTLTIQKNGASVATFTANSSSDVTANITVPTDTNDLTNGAGYITGINSSDVTTALGYTPVNPTSLASVATSGSYNDLLNKPTIPTVDQIYDATSSNAQSGVAVASAIAGLGITVDQVYDGTSANAQSGVAIAGELSNYVQSSSLATVATSGLYSDLSGTPTVDQTYDGTSSNAQSGVAIEGELANYVTTDTAQTISGAKTFKRIMMDRDIAKGSTPASDSWEQIAFMDNSGVFSDAKMFGRFVNTVGADGSTSMRMITYRNVANSTDNAYIYVQMASNGTVTTYAPACTNTNSIVTTTTRSLAAANDKWGFGNGLKIATKEISPSGSGDTTWSYGITFSTTPVVAICRRSGASTTSTNAYAWVRGDVGTSSCKVYASTGATWMLVAIGH